MRSFDSSATAGPRHEVRATAAWCQVAGTWDPERHRRGTHARHPPDGRRAPTQSLDDILSSPVATSAKWLVAAGISIPFAAQKVLNELRKLDRGLRGRCTGAERSDSKRVRKCVKQKVLNELRKLDSVSEGHAPALNGRTPSGE